jgi:hypothetical protein
VVVELPFFNSAAAFRHATYMLNSTAHWQPCGVSAASSTDSPQARRSGQLPHDHSAPRANRRRDSRSVSSTPLIAGSSMNSTTQLRKFEQERSDGDARFIKEQETRVGRVRA